MTTVPPRARPLDLVAAEWIKLRSLRSTYWVLLAAAATAFGLSLLVCAIDASQWTYLSPGRRATFDPTADSLAGFAVAQLLFAAIGVLMMTGEYSSGLIRTTLTAVPARRAVLAAKAAVACLVTVPVGLAVALAAFTAGQAILSRQHAGIALSQPGALRAVIATAAFLGAVTLLGLGAGTLLRSAAGALSVIVVLLFLAPTFLHGNSQWAIDIGNALPGTAIRRLISLHPWAGAPSVTQSVAVVIIYPVAALATAAWAIRRRDA